MQLNFPKKENGMYILSRDDIDSIATAILKKYYPQNLEMPLPLNTMELLEKHLGLKVKRKFIGTLRSNILGLIVMNDEVEIPSYDEMYRPTVLQETYGTVLISLHLIGRENINRRRYTEAHEGAHFILHGEYFECASAAVAQRGENHLNYIACRRMEIYNASPKNDTEWMEWQADSLAASLLMPKNIFYSFARNVIKENGISRGYLITSSYANKRQAFEIITKIAEQFNVSYRAAQIRMLHLGLIKDNNF
jgi:Zn-dependent peptidase ImmA (M78 family)